MTEPMTAAEYRNIWGSLVGPRFLAALEEREALLGERESTLSWNKIATKTINDGTEEIYGLRRRVAELESDAAVGALVRRIREHPALRERGAAIQQFDGKRVASGLTEESFRETLSHLDSLLPKEPEVVVGPSGWKYRVNDGRVEWCGVYVRKETWLALDPGVLVPGLDAPVVAALLARQEGKGNG